MPTYYESGTSLQKKSDKKYTIPKEKRFRNSFIKPACENIYDLPDFKTTKSTAMGYGHRKDIFNKREVECFPSPMNYKYPDLFEDNFKKGKGISISQKIKYKVIIFCYL